MISLRLFTMGLGVFLHVNVGAQTALLLSTGSSSLDNLTRTVLENADYNVAVGSPYTTFSGAELNGIDVVLLFPTIIGPAVTWE